MTTTEGGPAAPAVTVHLANCLDVLAELPDCSVDAVVTDPPYGLSNTDPVHVVEALTQWATGDRTYVPTGRGFMGKAWDAFVPPPAVWDECLRVLKPGGHLLSFAGSRTFDLMTLSIRFAGFDIRDGIAWLYGEGFPKSLDMSKAIDKLDAAEERLRRAREFQAWLREHLTPKRINEIAGTDMGYRLTTHPSQPAVATAGMFDQLRPHLPEVPERIEELVHQRTVESENFKARKVVRQVKRTGKEAGTLGAYAGDNVETAAHTPAAQQWAGWGTTLKPAFEPIVVARKPLPKGSTVAENVLVHSTGAINVEATKTPEGRWPTNVVLDDAAAAELDADTGTLTSGAGDSGGASRFFPVFRYQAKAPASERPSYVTEDGTKVAHLTVKPLELMRWLVRLVTPPGGTVLDPFAGSGTTVEACLLEGFGCLAAEDDPDSIPLIVQRVARVARMQPMTVEPPALFDDEEGVA